MSCPEPVPVTDGDLCVGQHVDSLPGVRTLLQIIHPAPVTGDRMFSSGTLFELKTLGSTIVHPYFWCGYSMPCTLQGLTGALSDLEYLPGLLSPVFFLILLLLAELILFNEFFFLLKPEHQLRGS